MTSRGDSSGADNGPTLPARLEADPRREIVVRGAREHNLQNVDVRVPRGRLVVFTGVSGSGKSSLAFDTIFAEGQRKYIESLSSYARQFLTQLRRPDVDDISGLPPTVAIEQRNSVAGPRSTVATTTEIHDYLRLLFARAGTAHCWEPIEGTAGQPVQRCGAVIEATPAAEITDTLCRHPENTRVILLAPLPAGDGLKPVDQLALLAREGFVRARLDGKLVDIAETMEKPAISRRKKSALVEAVVDRLVIRPRGRERVADSVETALKLGEGMVNALIEFPEDTGEAREVSFSERHACPAHPHIRLPALQPRLFSFNAPEGACDRCHGLGVTREFAADLVLPDPQHTLAEGIAPWAAGGPAARFSGSSLKRFCTLSGIETSRPIASLSEPERALLLHGKPVSGKANEESNWTGVIPALQQWLDRTSSEKVGEFLRGFMAERSCPECQGDRLSIPALSVSLRSTQPLPAETLARRRARGLALSTDSDAAGTNALDGNPEKDRAVKVGSFHIADLLRLSVDQALEMLDGLVGGESQRTIARPILDELRGRLGFLKDVGLGYLSLDRRAASLSGGEAQRIRLATQIGAGLAGAAYVLDEPTIGLHPRDTEKLIQTLRKLTEVGNTVIVVEHDPLVVGAADHIVDVGPGPGAQGGKIVAVGDHGSVMACEASRTGAFLAGRERIVIPAAHERRRPGRHGDLHIDNAHANNLRNLDIKLPLGGLVCVTGVSGSGKSTLVNDILLRALLRWLHGSKASPAAHDGIRGLESVARVVSVDQSPLGRTPRSNAATYTGIFDEIRKLLSQTPESRLRGWNPGRFSFNVKGGRCEVCQGQGIKSVSMHFLPDVEVPCEACRGSRYAPETLEVRFKKHHIAEILDMTVDQAAELFEVVPRISRTLRCLADVGLGYLPIGQPATTLSGGEAQRVRLAAELWKGSQRTGHSEHTLYVLDEPTTGLHPVDVARLVEVVHRLADEGNTLVVIEHNLDVIAQADWVIDLGPEGGREGGELIFAGTPEELVTCEASHTGAQLAAMLSARSRPSSAGTPGEPRAPR